MGGTASGAVFDSSLEAPARGVRLGQADAPAAPRLRQRAVAGAWTRPWRSAIRLSHGRYGGDFFEKVFGEVRTGLGRLEIGQTDGAAYVVAAGGPKVDAQVSLDDPQTTFFRDPATNDAVIDMFALRTAVGASSNYAKFAYVSPALFGAQLALSFTPNQGKKVLPFLHAGPHVPGRQADIWEAGLRYSTDFGSGHAHRLWRHRRRPRRAQVGAPGRRQRSGLSGFAPITWSMTISACRLGGSYRHSNAYAFDIALQAMTAPPPARCMSAPARLTTSGWRVSNMATRVAGSAARRAATWSQWLSGVDRLCAEQQLADHGGLAAAGVCPFQRVILQWRAAPRHGCGLSASQSARLG